MSDAFSTVGSGGSSGGLVSTPPSVPSLSSLITVDALADLKELLQRQDVRDTLVGISAVEALLLAEQVEHVKAIGSNLKKLVDYFDPGGMGGGPAGSPPPPGNAPSVAGPGGSGGTTGTPSHPTAAAARAPGHFASDLVGMLTPVVKMPVDQLRATVDSQGKAIDKGAAGIIDLQTAHTASNARLHALEAHYQRLEIAHRGLSDRVVEMGFELGETEDATEALGEAVREAGSPVIVVVEEGENTERDDPTRTTQARPMRQAGTPVRKAQARKKK